LLGYQQEANIADEINYLKVKQKKGGRWKDQRTSSIKGTGLYLPLENS